MSNEINHQVAKAIGATASAGAGAGAMVAEKTAEAAFAFPWAETAAALGALYSLTVLAEWWWKRLWRPLLIRKGWWSPRSPYFRADSDAVPLDAPTDPQRREGGKESP